MKPKLLLFYKMFNTKRKNDRDHTKEKW